MVTQTQTKIDKKRDQSEISENGVRTIDPSLIIPAIYPIERFLGIYKDDPYAAEVWDRIVASRHADRTEDTIVE